MTREGGWAAVRDGDAVADRGYAGPGWAVRGGWPGRVAGAGRGATAPGALGALGPAGRDG